MKPFRKLQHPSLYDVLTKDQLERLHEFCNENQDHMQKTKLGEGSEIAYVFADNIGAILI